MPTFTYSKKSRWWRPLCTNKLKAETYGGVPEPPARLCEVCVHPIEMPPAYNCWCSVTDRPQGVDSALIFTLGGSLGSDSASGTFLSNSGSVTYTNAGMVGVPDPTMNPADGAKSSVYDGTTIRDWITPSGDTEFIAKNLSVYLPSLPWSGGSACLWFALAGMHYVERLYHPTIVNGTGNRSFTYNDGLPRTGSFYGYRVAAPHEEIKRTVVLNNNDPASVWAGTLGQLTPSVLRQWVPQISNGMPADIGGPCRPVSCNNRCYPVNGHCWSNAAILLSTSQKWFSYWSWRNHINGYYWVIQRHPGTGAIGSTPSVWLAWFVARDVPTWSTIVATRPRPDSSFYAYTNENIMVPLGSNGTSLNWHYPASYHASIQTFTAPGAWSPYIGGMVSGSGGIYGGNGPFGGDTMGGQSGLIGTMRHPDWSGGTPTLYYFQCPKGSGNDVALACYATDELPCDFSGVADMQLIGDYRTPPNMPTGTIHAGPTSFPATATLQF